MRFLSILLAITLSLLLNVLPTQAGMLQDGSFIHDLKIEIDGKLGSELALKLIDNDLSASVNLGKGYCETRQAGLSQKDWLELAKRQIEELQNPEMEQSLWLLYKKTAKTAKSVYCPEFS